MAAISALLTHVVQSGDHLIMSDVAYAGASELVSGIVTRCGVEVSRVDLSDLKALKASFRPSTRLVYAETPANPILRLTDVAAVAEVVHEAGARFAVDSTFATPVALRPVELGADYVLHSLTKYIGGHGDAVGGALLGNAEDLAAIRRGPGIHVGGALSPFNAWLIMRGVATLPLRMRAHAEGALAVASFLERHPRVTRVLYPGLPSHPQYELACRQMDNASGMVSFQTEDGPETARRLARELQTVHYAVSLGHHRSLVVYLRTADLIRTSFRMSARQEAAYRAYAGDGLFRLSVGLEDSADIIADLEQALG
jgi:methionine-gamma-lyase